MTPAFASWMNFSHGRYAFFVWLAVVMTVIPLVVFGRALGDAASRNSAWRGATAGA